MDQDQCSASFVDVVELLLQHSDLPQCVRDFCQLLQTSTAVAAAAQRCRGRLEVKVHANTPAQAAALAPWLVRHGARIGFLDTNICPDYDENSGEIVPHDRAAAAAAGDVLVTALQQPGAHQATVAAAGAGAGAGGLLSPQRLQLWCLPEMAPGLLQVAGRQATWLSLGLEGAEGDDLADGGPTAAAVAALPSLRQLELSFTAQGLLPALSGCSSLTRLELEQVSSLAMMRALPTQLRSLKLNVQDDAEDAHGPWLPLQHHTALTKLEVKSWGGLSFGSEDVLPASLETLKMNGLPSVAPLLGLLQLRTLSLEIRPPTDLQQLSQLSKLTHIELTNLPWYDSSLLVASEAWSRLPTLRRLTIKTSSQPVLHNLSKATSLTFLHIKLESNAEGESLSVWAQTVAAALKPLTLLQQLTVSGKYAVAAGFIKANAGSASKAGMAALGSAIASLPRLHVLRSSRLPLSDVAPQLVNAGTQLTALDISGCYPMAESLSIMSGLASQLRSLHLSFIDDVLFINDLAPAECLAVVASHLRLLTELQLVTRCDLTLQAVGQLGSLPRLARLVLSRPGSYQHSAAEFRAALAAAGAGPGLQLEVDGRKG